MDTTTTVRRSRSHLRRWRVTTAAGTVVYITAGPSFAAAALAAKARWGIRRRDIAEMLMIEERS